MSVNLDDETMDRLTGGDEIVWSRSASRLNGTALEFTSSFLTRRKRDALVQAFGQAWLDAHLQEREREIDAWKNRFVM